MSLASTASERGPVRGLQPNAVTTGEVSGCTDDHRRLDPGQVFVAIPEAWPGYDGHVYVREALERGAAGVVVERPCPEAGRLQVVVADAMAAHARICQALAGDPSRQLLTIGVTGGFGRTIAALMVRSILVAAGQRIGLIGALGFCNGTTTRALGAGVVPRDGRTLTGARAGQGAGSSMIRGHHHHPHEPGPFVPGAASLAALMAEMVERGCKGGVLEVSSEALAHRGVEGVAFDAAVVTDVSAPHGFPPEVLIARRRAKAKLFRQVVPGGVTVVNADDAHAEILGGVNLDARRVAFALEPGPALGTDRSAQVDVSARLVRLDGAGTRMLLQGFDRETAVHLPLVGPRAATSAVAAAALAWALEIDLDAVIDGLEAVQSVAGHLEAVAEGQDFDVRIDAAQTPSALVEALAAVRAVAAGRVHCVLSAEGCGDRSLRRQLAEIAENGADRVILTLSNPRTEDPGQILDDLLAGFHRPGKVRVEPDRQLAIEAALSDARSGDVVLVAGKGRNTYQIFADKVIPFDDAAIARQWLRAHQPTPVQRSA